MILQQAPWICAMPLSARALRQPRGWKGAESRTGRRSAGARPASTHGRHNMWASHRRHMALCEQWKAGGAQGLGIWGACRSARMGAAAAPPGRHPHRPNKSCPPRPRPAFCTTRCGWNAGERGHRALVKLCPASAPLTAAAWRPARPTEATPAHRACQLGAGRGLGAAVRHHARLTPPPRSAPTAAQEQAHHPLTDRPSAPRQRRGAPTPH